MRQVTATEKLRAVNEGKMAKTEFVRQMRQSYPMYISQYSQFNDTVQILKNRGMLFEDYKNPSKNLSDDSIRRGLDYELTAMGLDPVTCTDSDAIVKARAKATTNINKDPLHYYNLLSGDSSKVNKHDKQVETKRGALEKDTFNDMKKATLKERKERLVEGTRALVGYLAGDRLTTTYNHYDGYPSHLGKALQMHYNDDDKAKEIAMKGYITGIDADTGDVSATHNEKPGKLVLPDDKEQRAREIAEEIDSYGAEYGYVWDDNSNQWVTIKNTGIRSMIDQIIEKLDMVNVHSGETMEGDLEETEEEYLAKKDAAIKQAMGKDIEEIDTSLDPLEDKKEIIKQVIELIKSSMPADNETIKSFIRTHYNDIINSGDDNAILDEFQEFLSVNTDYVDETDAYDNDDETQAMIDKMRKDGKDADDFVDENEGKDHDVEILNYIADTYIQNAKDGDKAYAGFLDLNIRDAVQDVVGIIQDPKHPLHRETRKEYQIVSRDKARGLFEKKGKDHDDVYGDGDVVVDISGMSPGMKAVWEIEKEISEFGDSNDAQLVVDNMIEINSEEHLVSYLQDRGIDTQTIVHMTKAYNSASVNEKKGKDHDGDGDVDGDDYKHAKDKAIKKAMGKKVDEAAKVKKLKKLTVGGKTYEKGDFDPNDDGRIMSIEKYPNGYYITGGVYSDYGDGDEPKEGYGYAIDLKGNEMDEEDLEGLYEGNKPKINEAVKNIITKVLEEQLVNEAATNDLAKIAAEYGDFEGLKPAVIALENVVTEIESFYDKTRSKIQKIYNDLGEIKNEEGLKVGAFIAPSIENAFKRDLRPITKQQFHGGLDMPKVKRISQTDIDRGYIQQEAPKETVFTPVNEKK